MKKLLLLAFLITSGLNIIAQTFEDYARSIEYISYISDHAIVLSTDEKVALANKIDSIRSRHGIDIAICIIDSCRSFEAKDIAEQLGNNWTIGSHFNDQGVLILVSVLDRKTHIATTEGLTDELGDDEIQKVVNNVFRPLLKDDLFVDAFYLGLDEIEMQFVSGQKTAKKNNLIMGIIVLCLFTYSMYKKSKSNDSHGHRSSSGRSHRRSGGFRGGGGGGGF